MATVITIVIDTGDETITKEVTVRGEVTTDDLVIKTRTVNAPTTKNPFHPDAISIADLKAGVRVRMHYLGGRTPCEKLLCSHSRDFRERQRGSCRGLLSRADEYQTLCIWIQGAARTKPGALPLQLAMPIDVVA